MKNKNDYIVCVKKIQFGYAIIKDAENRAQASKRAKQKKHFDWVESESEIKIVSVTIDKDD